MYTKGLEVIGYQGHPASMIVIFKEVCFGLVTLAPMTSFYAWIFSLRPSVTTPIQICDAAQVLF